MSKINRYAAISKVEDNDDGSITIYGVASTEAVDAHGEVVTKAAMENAIPDFMKYGTGALRAMHQPIAAGTVTKATVNENGETEIEAVVVDPVEITKVKAGVYKGLSIGGSKVPGGYDKVTKTISAMKLTEISLVDRPANPEAVISMWKSEDIEATVTVSAEDAAAVDALAELMNKGAVSPVRLVALAQAEIAKADDSTKDSKDGGDAGSEDGKDGDKDKTATKDGKDAEGSGDDADDTEKAAKAGDVKKGMYGVSTFASLLTSIGYMVSDAEWEADCEKDNSPVPAQLRAWLSDGAKIFQAMAAEEVAEFVALFGTSQDASAAVVSLDVELSAKAGDLKKSLTEAAGKSLVDYLSIAKAHMAENDIAKAVLADGFEKTTETIVSKLAPGSELVAKLADAEGTIAKLSSENEVLKAENAALKAQPAASKATLKIVVEKGQDVADINKAVQDEIVKRADGSIDHEATAKAQIMKMHQTGGQRLLR